MRRAPCGSGTATAWPTSTRGPPFCPSDLPPTIAAPFGVFQLWGRFFSEYWRACMKPARFCFGLVSACWRFSSMGVRGEQWKIVVIHGPAWDRASSPQMWSVWRPDLPNKGPAAVSGVASGPQSPPCPTARRGREATRTRFGPCLPTRFHANPGLWRIRLDSPLPSLIRRLLLLLSKFNAANGL